MAQFRGLRADQGPQCAQLSSFQLGYIAALLDGEGSLWHDKRTHRSHYFVEITNTNREFLEKAKEMLGIGKIVEKPIPPYGRKPIYRLFITRTEEVEALLQQLLPYLIVKQDKAKEILRLTALRRLEYQRYMTELEETHKLYAQGLSSNEVGALLGITEDAVLRRLRKLGIRRRRRL